MKLSEVKGKRVFEVMADLVGPVSNMAMSESMRSVMKPEPCPEGMDSREFMLGRIKEALPAIINEHDDDIVSVLATIGGVSADEYLENMTFVSLLSDVLELVSDGDFLDFLFSLNALMG